MPLPADRNARERPSGAQAGRRGRPWSITTARGGWLPSVAASHNVDFRTALVPLGWSHSTTTYATCFPSGESPGALAQRMAAMSSGCTARFSHAGPLAPPTSTATQVTLVARNRWLVRVMVFCLFFVSQAAHLRSKQDADGSWKRFEGRPPTMELYAAAVLLAAHALIHTASPSYCPLLAVRSHLRL